MPKNLNLKLKARIIEKFGWQWDFALAIKGHESFISRVVCGRRELPEEKKKKWANVLQCNPEDIFPVEDADGEQ